jgi:tRNA(adenine34) deaminase
MFSDEFYMAEAIKEARLAEEIDEVPVGAVIVRNGEIIARAHNLRENSKDPSAHAEVLAIRQAAEVLGGWRLSDCTLYVTLEPCPMCAGACINSRLKRVVFGAYDKKAGCCGTLYNLLTDSRFNHNPEVTDGISHDECSKMLSDYFKKKRI